MATSTRKKKKKKTKLKKKQTKKRSRKKKPSNGLGDIDWDADKPALPPAVGVQPLDDRVIVRIEDAESVSPGGIVLPQQAQEPSQFAEVVAVGPGAPWKEYVIDPRPRSALQSMVDPLKTTDSDDKPKPSQLMQPRYPMTLGLGERVIISRFAGALLEINGEKYTILREADILARCNDI